MHVKWDYFTKMLICTLIFPLGLGIAVLFYLLPLYLMDRFDYSDNNDGRVKRELSRQSFWQRVYVCLSVFCVCVSVRDPHDD